MKILIMGLPGSGKTTLASGLNKRISGSVWFNGDLIREKYNDWDFSKSGRIRQAQRMSILSSNNKISICDFVCPTPELRKIYNPDIVIFMDTIKLGRFTDTNKVFIPIEPSEGFIYLAFHEWSNVESMVDRCMEVLGSMIERIY